ncbi:MAG: cytochrome C oxidase subunit IV family protein [Rhizomicrobium sp.]
MGILSRARLALVWLALSAITFASWWIGTQYDHGFAKPDAVAFLGVIAIAAIKVRVIFREFMDVRHAPARLKHLTDAWLGLTVVALVTAYFV